MKPDPDAVSGVLSRRVDLEALYLGGPFDAGGEPASPDVHVLAISRGDSVGDLHLVPGVSRFDRRVEVSVVPLGLVRQAVERGVSTWFAFYTVDKLRTGKPVLEPPEAARLRQRALEGLRIRPAFYADVLRGVVQAGGHLVGPSDDPRATPATGPAPAPGLTKTLALGGKLTALLAAHTAVKSGRTFAKLSDMLSRGAPFPVALPEASKATAGRALAATATTLARAFTFCGIDPARLAPAPAPTDRGPAEQGPRGQGPNPETRGATP